jgi:hypothetical protein
LEDPVRSEKRRGPDRHCRCKSRPGGRLVGAPIARFLPL